MSYYFTPIRMAIIFFKAGFLFFFWYNLGFPDGSVLKKLPAMQETQVWFLEQEDPLEEDMAIHSKIIAWEIQWTEEPGRLQSMGSQRVGYD